MTILCRIRGHRWAYVATIDVDGIFQPRTVLWQCTCCHKLDVTHG